MLTLCFSFFACGKDSSNSSSEPILSLQELVSDPDFQKIFTDEEDDVFTYAVSASDDTTFIINGDGTVMTERTLE